MIVRQPRNPRTVVAPSYQLDLATDRLTIPCLTMPQLRVVARKHAARHRGGAEEYRLTLTFRWPNGHTMSFVANDTVTAPLMHGTLMPALQDAFPVDLRGVPTIPVVHHRAIMATPAGVRVIAGAVGTGMLDE